MLILAECNIPPVITGILSQLYKIIIIAIPIGIVLFGTIDFLKAAVSKNTDNVSSSTKTFITRLITGCLTFFVLTIVNWLFTKVIGSVGGASSAMQCAKQIIGGNTTATSGNNGASSAIANNMFCYGTEISNCLRNNQSPNRQSECAESAKKVCNMN